MPLLAELNIELGREERTRRALKEQIVNLRQIARKLPNEYQIWLTAVRCAVLSKDYTEALDIVKEGLKTVSTIEDKRKLSRLASMILRKKSDDFLDMSVQQQYRQRLYTLCEAIKINPTDRDVYLKLLDYISDNPALGSGLPATGVDPRIAKANGERLDFSQAGEFWMSDSIVGSPVPGIIHALLGMRDVSQGNVSDGEKHWRIAEEQYSNSQIIINNLIDVAAKDRSDEFSNMQDMITLGIELFPEQPIFYQTRGVFLMNQGKFNEAIVDLLYASEKMPKMIALHRHLIDCYQALGDEQKVTEQQSLLQEKLSQLDVAERKLVESSMQSQN
jgi:tetratricopeptide (TPR) repeat protein